MFYSSLFYNFMPNGTVFMLLRKKQNRQKKKKTVRQKLIIYGPINC